MRFSPIAALLVTIIPLFPAAASAQPMYSIVDLDVLPGHTQSFGTRISPNGIATGYSLSNSTSMAFRWTQAGGMEGLPNLTMPDRPFGRGSGVNENGVVAGNGAQTVFQGNPLPLIWQGANVSQLPLPAGSTVAAALDLNNANVAVGVTSNINGQFGVRFSGGLASIITQTTANGSFVTSAYAINNGGRIVGQGADPNNASVNVGYVLDNGAGSAFAVGALQGFNGAICFDVSESGHVTGTSMLNQGNGLPFIYSDAAGIRPVSLPPGSFMGEGRGVNSAGFVVGNSSTLSFSVPFFWDGGVTYRLGDLLPAGSGWDLLNNITSSALGISEDGIIVGTGLHNGEVRAFAMIPVPEPGSLTLALLIGGAGITVRRWRSVSRRFAEA